MALPATIAGWCVAPPSAFKLPSMSSSSAGRNYCKLSANFGFRTIAAVVASSPRAFVERDSGDDDTFGNLEIRSGSISKNPRNNEMEERQRPPKKSWKSQTGRNSRRKYGDRMTSILEVLRSEADVESTLESLKVKLNSREQSVILNEQRDWRRALEIFSWFKKQESYTPNIIHYNIMLRILGRTQQWKLLEEFWAEMQQGQILPTNVTFSTLIDVYDRGGRTEKALQWLEIMKSRGLQLDTAIANTVINVHKRHGNVAAAEAIFTDLRSSHHRHLQDTEVKTSSVQVKRAASSETPANMGSLGDVETFNSMIDMYGRAGRFADASRIFSDMMEAGIAPDTVTFNTMIKVCGLAGRIQEAEAMYLKMDEKGVVSDLATFNILIANFCREGNLQVALEYLERMKAKEIVPDQVTYHTLLGALASRDRVMDVELICHEMQELGLAPDESISVGLVLMHVRLGLLDRASEIVTNLQAEGLLGSASYAAIIDVYGEQRLWYEAEIMFLRCKPKWTVEICNTMMKAYGLAGLHDRAVEVLRSLEESSLVPDETTFNTVLHSLMAIVPSDVEKVQQVLLRTRSMNCKLQRSTYNLLIGFYSKLGLLREAEETFKQMVTDGVALDAGSYGALLNAYAEQGLVKEAQKILADMKEAGFPANEVVLTTLMKSHARAGKLEEARRVFMDLGRQCGGPDLYATNFLIELYALDGMIKDAETVYKQLEDKANEVTLTTMLEMYKRARLVKRALEMATRILNMSSLRDVAPYNSVLGLYTSLGRVTEAVEVFESLESRKVCPDIRTYTIMAGALKRIGSVQEAIDLLCRASSTGLPQSLQSLTTLVNVYARAQLLEETFEVCNKLRHASFSLDAAAYNALIFAYGSAGQIDESLRMFMEMQSRGLEPDAVTYITLITVYGRAGSLEGVTRIFKRMKQAGFEPSMATYKAVIDIYRNAGKMELAAMVNQEMKFTEFIRQQDSNHLRDIVIPG